MGFPEAEDDESGRDYGEEVADDADGDLSRADHNGAHAEAVGDRLFASIIPGSYE